MNLNDLDTRFAEIWEGAVAFRFYSMPNAGPLSIPEQLASKIGDRIISGQLAPGARLAEVAIATEFSVSRSPVRESFRILEREGLATVHPRRGAFVTQLSHMEQRDIFEIRASLLELVARRTIAQRDPSFLSLMHKSIQRLKALADLENDNGQYAELVYKITLISARLTQNDRLYRMIGSLSLQTLRYSKLGLAAQSRRKASLASWIRSYEALESGDMVTHVNLTRQRLEASRDEAERELQSAGSSRHN